MISRKQTSSNFGDIYTYPHLRTSLTRSLGWNRWAKSTIDPNFLGHPSKPPWGGNDLGFPCCGDHMITLPAIEVMTCSFLPHPWTLPNSWDSMPPPLVNRSPFMVHLGGRWYCPSQSQLPICMIKQAGFWTLLKWVHLIKEWHEIIQIIWICC